MIFCDQSTVAMGVCTRLTTGKLTLLTSRSPAGRATDGKCLLHIAFCLHGEMMNQTVLRKMVKIEQLDENVWEATLLRGWPLLSSHFSPGAASPDWAAEGDRS